MQTSRNESNFIKIVSKLTFVHFWNKKWHPYPPIQTMNRKGANDIDSSSLMWPNNIHLAIIHIISIMQITRQLISMGLVVVIWLILMLIQTQFLPHSLFELDDVDYGYHLYIDNINTRDVQHIMLSFLQK